MVDNKSKNRIFGFGTAALDFRISTADLGQGYKDKLLAQHTYIMGGGSVANCLTQISRLNARATWLGKLGNDWIGKETLRQLKQENIDCSNVIRDSDLCSPFNVAVYAGENKRRIGGFLLPNSINTLSQGDIKKLTSCISVSDWVMVEIGEISIETTLEFCKAVKAKRAKLAIDVDLDPIVQCGGDRKDILEIFSLADMLIPNREALGTIYHKVGAEGLAHKMCEEYNVTTIVTASEDGVFYQTPGKKATHVTADDNCKIVDTIGAGDAFHGGLMYGVSQGMDIHDAVRLGIRCARINCCSFGARTGMPTKEDLKLYGVRK